MSENNQTYGDGLSAAWIQADKQVRQIRNEVTRAMQEGLVQGLVTSDLACSQASLEG
jgi:hypothetical protein